MEYDKYRPTNVFLAAAFCGTVFALESANIVGYTELALNAGGKNMVGPCFVNTGSTTIKLSDIEVTGYENSDYYMWTDMAAPVVVIQKLLSNGQPERQYSWSAEFDGENWLDGSWVKDIGDVSAADWSLAPGEGMWVQCPDLEDCEKFTMVFPAAL